MSDEESKLIKRVINAAMDVADSLSVSRFVSLAKDKELRLAVQDLRDFRQRKQRLVK